MRRLIRLLSGVLGVLVVGILLGAGVPVFPLVVLPLAVLLVLSRWASDRWRRAARQSLHGAYLAFLWFYAAASIVWLLLGIGPAVARGFPSMHEALHRWSGTRPAALVEQTVAAKDGRFDSEVITLQGGAGEAQIRFINKDADGHNVAIYPIRGNGILFRGAIVEATTAVYEFTRPPPGVYLFVCDPHAEDMRGLLIVEAAAPGASSVRQPDARLPGPLAALARRTAEASHAAQPLGRTSLQYVFSAISVALGILVVRLRPGDRAARLLAIGLIGTAAVFNLEAHTALTVVPALAGSVHGLFHLIAGGAYVLALVVFPDGRVPAWPMARMAWLKYPTLLALSALALAGFVVGSGVHGNPSDYVTFFGVIVPIAGIASQAARLRQTPTGAGRRQSRLLMWVLALALGGALLLIGLTSGLLLARGTGEGLEQVKRLSFLVFPALFSAIPIALVIVLVRYRLWDVERVLNKALVYGTLAAFITAVYVAAVVGIGAAVRGGEDPNVLEFAVASAVAAVAFEPLRELMQRVANRLVYGRRATPYQVMADFSERVSGAMSVDEVLPRMAEVAATGVGAARARVRVFLPDGTTRAVTWPNESSEESWDRTITIDHQGEPVGDLWVATPPGQPLTPTESTLLDDLASQAGVALRNVRLTEELEARLAEISVQADELRASRERIVATQDAERRRLERDIHDGAQQQLAAIAVKIRVATEILEREPSAASGILEQLGSDATAALEDLRDLARGVFPPLLADRGLASALQAQVRKASLPVRVEIGEGADRRFPSEVEAAVYFCCLEAMANAAKHAGGSPVTLMIAALDGWLRFAVRDAGPGFDPARVSSGQGLLNMADRIEAVGGLLRVDSAPGRGTTVEGRIPVRALEPVS